jgi:hypothetical protein
MGNQSRLLTGAFQLTALDPMLRTSQSPTLKRRTSLQGKREFKIGMIIDRSGLPGISISDPVHGKDIPLPPPRQHVPCQNSFLLTGYAHDR